MHNNEDLENFDDSKPEEEIAFNNADAEVTDVPEAKKQRTTDFKIPPRLRKFEIDDPEISASRDELENSASHSPKVDFIEVWKRFNPNRERRRGCVLYWLLWLYTFCVIAGIIVFLVTKNIEVLGILVPGILLLLKRTLDWL